jgi:hypothetical protein
MNEEENIVNCESGQLVEMTAPDIVNSNDGFEKGEPWSSGIKPTSSTYREYVANKRRFNLHPMDAGK